jgi:lysozyme family protein
VSTFDAWVDFAIGRTEHAPDPDSEEGGYSDDPHDPGGITYRGVTLRRWREFKDDPSITPTQLRDLSRTDIGAFAWAEYWLPAFCPALPRGVDFMVMDHAFNAGPGSSVEVLQGMLGVAQDGAIGPITLGRLRGLASAVISIPLLADAQLADYKTKSGWQFYAADWTARLNRRRALALTLAS